MKIPLPRNVVKNLKYLLIKSNFCDDPIINNPKNLKKLHDKNYTKKNGRKISMKKSNEMELKITDNDITWRTPMRTKKTLNMNFM